MRRSSAAIALLLAVFLAGCQQAGDPEAGGIPESASVPLLQPHFPYAPERDDPPALRAEFARRQREGLALLRKASHAHADAAGGCVHSRPSVAGPPQAKLWLPRPPKITARLLGRQVEVEVELQGNPTSLVCRPTAFAMVVSSGTGGTSSFNNTGGVAEFALYGPAVRTAPRRFRVLGHIPDGGSPPYHLSVDTEALPGSRSTYVEQVLRCPTTGDTTRGCLDGPVLGAHAITIPSPVLPLRGVSAGALERSLAAALAWDPEMVRIGAIRCPSTTTCSVAVRDPFREAKGTARYRIQGDQVAGCWLGTLTGVERTPAEAELVAPSSLGGCVTWR